MSSISFLSELKNFTNEFSKYAKTYFSQRQKVVKKYPPLISRLYRELEEFGVGGKAMRPFLVYLGCRIGLSGQSVRRSDLKKILPICLAFEMVHNFLLIHDDIIDKSGVRRGKQTVHKKFEENRDEHYGISQAIVAGDIAFLEALDLINKSNYSNELKSRCMDLLVKVILDTGYGQVLDVDYAYMRSNLKNIRQVVELKTARYSFVGPLTIGAVLGGAKDSQIKALEKFGLLCGMAYQLQDDILGVFGDEKTLGKSTLSDMQEGKNTVLFYKTRDLASNLQGRLLDKVWGDKRATVSDLLGVQTIMKDCGALVWCQKEMKKLVKDAKKSVDAITGDSRLAAIFYECADFVIFRKS